MGAFFYDLLPIRDRQFEKTSQFSTRMLEI
ncbi:hypothetical protein Pan161_51300 [Gimesia algae]|uniref:Uncharacterized protein n=1 Tax=Gimesia algae TaxID=2527971 RepID=A0A517VKA4_9PLAN|nr:hypothetical protein Pan161_51300 [Gimesia algae]